MRERRRAVSTEARSHPAGVVLRAVLGALIGAVLGSFLVQGYLQIVWPDAKEGGMIVIFVGPPLGLVAGVFLTLWKTWAGRIGALIACIGAGVAVSLATVGSENVIPPSIASALALLPGALLGDRIARGPPRARHGGT